MPQRRQKASPKLRSQSSRESVEGLRRALKRESEERKEALERERATSDILRVIAESRTDIQPVFDTIVRNAVTLCGGMFANAFRYDGEQLHLVATTHKSAELQKFLAERYPMRPHERQASGRAILAKATVKIEDALADGAYDHRHATLGAWRRVLAVPMLRSGESIGVIAVAWAKPGSISKSQEQLLKTFADQAVIAIENVRLLNELKTSNSSLREALDQQTATAEVLRVIAGTPADARPVFQAIAQSAQRVFDAAHVAISLRDGDSFRCMATAGAPDPRGDFVLPLDRNSSAGRAMLDRAVLDIADTETPDAPPFVRESGRLIGFRAVAVAPMLRKGEAIGSVHIMRRAAGALSQTQLDLLRSFADQAVIAIENARLFNETKEALERQTATSEILRVISSSPTDLQPVFDTIARNFIALSGAAFGSVYTYDGRLVHHAGGAGLPPEQDRVHRAKYPVRVDDSSVVSARTIRARAPVHVEDALADAHYDPERARSLGVRRILGVPMLREGEPLGALTAGWYEAGPTPKQHEELLRTFADQAAIAIENVRLFNETKEALEQQTAISEVLRVISNSPADVEPVLRAVAERATRVCQAIDARVFLLEGANLRYVAGFGDIENIKQDALVPVEGSVMGEAVRERRTLHVDVAQLSEGAYPFARQRYKERGDRIVLTAPLMREDRPLGTILLRRMDAQPFSDKQVALLKTFADQAAIAIENVRLFNETKESLEQQTATGEILEVIACSPTNVQPVFDSIAQSCVRLFGGMNVTVTLARGERIELAAFATKEGLRAREQYDQLFPLPLNNESVSGRAILSGEVVYVADPQADHTLGERTKAFAKAIGYHNVLCAPMIRDGKGIGTINVMRGATDTAPYTEKQIALFRAFANQAVIAIENARLFNETKEALERQTATAEILNVISSTPTDVQPVFEVIVKSALRLLEGHSAVVTRIEGDIEHLGAYTSTSPSGDERVRSMYPRPVSRSGGAGTRAIATGKPNMIADYESDPTISETARQTARIRGYRSSLVVPMLREGIVVGTVRVTRKAAGPFPDHQVKLLQTFADQAVIAIENVRLFNETKEALEQQTAISEILRVISDSPTDVQPVLDAVAARAARICDATDARIFLVDGQDLRHAAGFGDVPINFDALPLDRGSAIGRAVIDRAPIHVDDMQTQSEDEYRQGRKVARHTGWRTVLAVPLLREGRSLGVIALRRMEMRAFSDKQISLLKTFADQAAIAIENVRLFNETRESLERQTATGEILSSISSSVADAQPVFDAIVRSLCKLFGTRYAVLALLEGDRVELKALAGDEKFTAHVKAAYPYPATDEGMIAMKAMRQGRVVQLSPIVGNPEAPAKTAELARITQYNSVIAAPLMREGRAMGYIATVRAEATPFDEKQVQLIRSFADQAVIAIENARLFKELQARTKALTKSVGQLTALGEVGQAISSTLDLEKVLKTIVSRAVQLAGLDAGWIYEFDERDERFHLRAAEHVEEEILQVSRSPLRLGEGAVGRAGATREPVVVEDVLDESYQSRVRELLIKSGSRALLAVPLLREDLLLGALVVSRNSPGPFVPEVIDLLKTFATQSAVAIQNARLFNETKEALDQQKASAEVLTAISSSIADTGPVFEKILESCQRLFAGRNVGINVVGDDGKVHIGAYRGPGRAGLEAYYPVPLSMESGSGAAIVSRQVVHYPDCDAPDVPEYARRGAHIVGNKSFLIAPMLWEGKGVGAIYVGRPVTGSFSEKEVALLRTFADQAVIAIQNAKLFREIQEKSAQLEVANRQLEVANKHKSDFLANMSHELRTPLNAIIGFSEALMERMFGDMNEKQLDYQKDIHESGKHLLSLINDILDLSKIEAGHMELELSTFHLPTAVSNAVTLIRERALRHGIALGVEVDPRLGEFQADERKVKQILLNLLSNAVKFTPDGGRVDVSARGDSDKVEIAVKDTGVGIAPEDQASLFEEFKQLGKDSSRKAEGTGLGLALTKRLVELHGGQILVDSAVGTGSTFRVMLPLRH